MRRAWFAVLFSVFVASVKHGDPGDYGARGNGGPALRILPVIRSKTIRYPA
jgi:hypothetical protein